MPSLVVPTTTVHASFLAAIEEERLVPHESRLSQDQFAHLEAGWHEPAGFAAYVTALRADAREQTPRPDGYVPATTLWWVDGDQFLGRIQVRHEMTEFLREVGGHIGYVVRPSARRRRHATAMLGAVLPVAAGLGIEDALVTTDDDNVASQRAILANGGRFVEVRGGKRHYRVATG